MLAHYSLICMPLDPHPASTSQEFAATLVTRLVIDPSATLSDEVLQRIISRHPILSLLEPPVLQAVVMDFNTWNGNGRKIDPAHAIPVSLTYNGIQSIGSIKDNLTKLFTGTQNLKALQSLHDRSFDELETKDFVEVNRTADQIRALRTQLISALRAYYVADAPAVFSRWKSNSKLESAEDFQHLMSLSFAKLRWLDGCAQAVLVKLLSGPIETDGAIASLATGTSSETLTDARNGIAKVLRRVTPMPDPPSALTLPAQVSDPSDLNLALNAILKNEFLARTFGFTTRWRIKPSSPLPANASLIIDMSANGFNSDADIQVDSPLPTVFAHTTHTHPVSYSQVGAPAQSNGAFVVLTSGSQARYIAATLSAEHAIFKEVILQHQNTDEAGDEAASHSLPAVRRFGLNEPETYGVSISAPPEDLVTHPDLRSDENGARPNWPCYFMDDLWIGYRLDLRNTKHGAMTSTHSVHQVVEFSGSRFDGESEDFIDREQPDDRSLGSSSTELTVYRGLSSGQLRDYLFLTEGRKVEENIGNRLYRLTSADYGKTEALSFGDSFEYRLRPVLAGGVSVPVDSPTPADEMKQLFPFFRAKALKAGVILSGRAAPSDGDNEAIILSPQMRQTYVTVIPTPIDIDTARFHGLLFKNENEQFRHINRRFIKDLTKAFPRDPELVDYFCDPDVYGFVLTVTVLNPDSGDAAGFEIVDGVYCELRPHLQLDPVIVDYGPEGKWEKFKPIRISFHRASNREVEISVKKSWLSLTEIVILVPPSVTVALSLRPRFNPRLLNENASHLSSSAQMLSPLFLDQPGRLTPAIAEVNMEVVNSISDMRSPPVAFANRFITSTDGHDATGIALATRERDSTLVQLPVRIDVDAASTGQIKLEAKWNEVADSPSGRGFAFRAATAATALHSLTFKRHAPPPPSATAMMSMLSTQAFAEGVVRSLETQLIEDKVFIDHSPDGQVHPIQPLDLKSRNRVLLKVQAVGVARYTAAQAVPYESRSNELIFDVPNSGVLPALRLSHAIPLLRPRIDWINSTTSQQTTEFGIRAYFHGPFGVSGIGERFAIGVLNDPRGFPTPIRDVPKNVSQWGEDPVSVAHLPATSRLPRASDFVAISGERHLQLDPSFYPPDLIGGDAAVIYRDNVETGNVDRGLAELVSLASFAAEFSEEQGLWYVDFSVANFFGWCGLAIYRHQPHSARGREISPDPAWIYASMLYGEPIAVVRSGTKLAVTVGPVFDRTINFRLSALDFEDGVSSNLGDEKVMPVEMASYRAGQARYFQAKVADTTSWTLETLRFGNAISRRLILPQQH